MKVLNWYIVILLCVLLKFTTHAQLKVLKLLKGGNVVAKNYIETIPFEYINNFIVVKVKLGNDTTKYNFIVDTGAPTVIDTSLKKYLVDTPIAQAIAVDANKQSNELNFSSLPLITIGNMQWNNIGTAIMKIKELPAIMSCMNISGIIGSNLLKKSIVEIRYLSKEICFSNKRPNLFDDSAIRIIKFKTKNVNGTPLIKMIFAGSVEDEAEFDTGAVNTYIACSAGILQNNKLTGVSQKRRGIGVSSYGAFGGKHDTDYVALAKNIAIDKWRIDSCMIEFTRGSSLMGNAFLQNYNVLIDWEKKEIVFMPHALSTSIKSTYKEFGFSYFQNNNKLDVTYLVDDSPAQKAGLQIGDQIVMLNGANTTELSESLFCELLFKNPLKNETAISMRILRNNKKIDVVLKKE